MPDFISHGRYYQTHIESSLESYQPFGINLVKSRLQTKNERAASLSEGQQAALQKFTTSLSDQVLGARFSHARVPSIAAPQAGI